MNHGTYIRWQLKLKQKRSFRRKNIPFVIALDLIKRLKQIK